MTSAIERATPKNQEPRTKNRLLVNSRSPAESVARETRSGPRWEWWREVNPIDGEVCAQPWSNLGLVDLDHADTKRVTYARDKHKCSPCEVTWDGPGPCPFCGKPPDDRWSADSGPAIGAGLSDGSQRRLP